MRTTKPHCHPQARATARRIVEHWLAAELARCEAGEPHHDKDGVFPRLCGYLDISEALWKRWQKLRSRS